MHAMKPALLAALAVVALAFVGMWGSSILRAHRERQPGILPGPLDAAVGFITNFFDTLGIGSFATTISLFKLWGLVKDEEIPGTLNVGHTLPSIVEAFIFIVIVQADGATVAFMVASSAAGAWMGAEVVSRWPRRKIQVGMGSALMVGAAIMTLTQLRWLPGGGDLLGLSGGRLAIAVGGNFFLGAFMTLGIGLYAPCMMLVSLLGMNPRAAFPIMMGSCAFLMPVGSTRFIRAGRLALKPALGLTIGGIPGVLLAAYLVKSLPLGAVRWLVVMVVIYTAALLLRSAAIEKKAAARLASPYHSVRSSERNTSPVP